VRRKEREGRKKRTGEGDERKGKGGNRERRGE